MSNERFDIIFRGDVVLGHGIVDVKQRLAQLFKIDSAKVDALFAGRAIPLKRNLDSATAEKYQAILEKAGAQVQVRSAGGDSAKPKAPARPVSRSSSTRAPQESKKLTLKERLALQEQQEQQEQQREKSRAEEQQATPSDPSAATAAFGLAPVGSDLRDGQERQTTPVSEVDLSHLSLRPPEGDLLDDSEKRPAVEPTVNAGHYDVADAGSDLLKPEERKPQEAVEVEIGDYDVAAVGVDLLDAADKVPLPELEIDTSIFDLAPTGSDLGQAKKGAPPPPPDTSNLKLAD